MGRKAHRSLYDRDLATYDEDDSFDQSAAVGFINLWGLQSRVQARTQMLEQLEQGMTIALPTERRDGGQGS